LFSSRIGKILAFFNIVENEDEDSKRQNEISIDEEGIHLNNLALMDNKIIEP